jgi:outer membrane receptor protein involved in Fe transport
MNTYAAVTTHTALPQRARTLALAFSLALVALSAPAMQAHAATVDTAVGLGQTAEDVDASGATVSSRHIRITNIRANASQLGTSSTLVPTQIQGM